MATEVDEFVNCLTTMSHSRAGWDYEMSREQRHKEDKAEKQALAMARDIWVTNPSLHDALRAAFTATKPLATMNEIERA